MNTSDNWWRTRWRTQRFAARHAQRRAGDPANGAARAVRFAILFGIMLGVMWAAAPRAHADTVIPLNAHPQLATFYLTVNVGGIAASEYLVDTGAGFMTVTESTLVDLRQAGKAAYLRHIEGRVADGRVLRVGIYLIEEIVIGDSCVLRDVEVAVLPGATRGLFGLSALRRTSSFEISMDPPTLRLSDCGQPAVVAAAR